MDIPYEHIKIMPVRAGSFFPTMLHALHIEHLVEDVSAEPLDCILIYPLKQTIIFSLLGNTLSHPNFVEHLNQHANQVLRKDRYLPTLQNTISKYRYKSS